MILVIGKHSFLAKNFLEFTTLPVRVISHTELANPANWAEIDCVVNYAFPPSFYVSPYVEGEDIDLRAGRMAKQHGCHYVMLSSRRVYGAGAQWGAREEYETIGMDVYGRNKALIEKRLVELLNNKITILRPGNVFGYEVDSLRSRFGAYMLNQLWENGEIRLTFSPFVRRDIVPVDFFSEVMDHVLRQRPPTILNVGASEAVEVGKVAIWLLKGFGGGRLIIDSPCEADEFWLDCNRLETELGLRCGLDRLAEFTKSLGMRLRNDLCAVSK